MKMEKNFKITEEERELIEAIRNYKNSFHNRSEELLAYAFEMFYKLVF